MQNTRAELDETDKSLLSALQKDAHLTAQDLGDRLGLSASQAGRRRQRLEQAGYIKSYGARLNPPALGLTVQAFIQVQMSTHDPEAARTFLRMVTNQPEIVSAWIMTGEADYLLRAWCEDLPALNRLIQDILLPQKAVARVQSQIVMDQPKADAPLPL
ncbi:MAG: Lrp/AsnC family transcriptional regulator [Pseudomonadota bacterium]